MFYYNIKRLKLDEASNKDIQEYQHKTSVHSKQHPGGEKKIKQDNKYVQTK
jgi:hypothetical protein